MKKSEIQDSLLLHYGLKGALIPFDSYDDEIYRVDSPEGSFILKVYHKNHSISGLRMQMELMRFLDQAHSTYEVPAAIPSQSGEVIPKIADRWMTLHPFLDGVLMGKANPILPSTRRSLGAMLGSFQETLDGLRIDGDRYDLTWDNGQVHWLAKHLNLFGNHREIIEKNYKQFLSEESAIKNLRKSIIHNDANENNLFVKYNEENEYITSGVIDFGDSIYSQSVNDLAIACAYAMMGVPDPLAAAADIIEGYNEVWPLTEMEIKHLFILIKVRLINSLAHSILASSKAPDNEYILIHQRPTVDLLHQLDHIDANYAHYYFRSVCRWTPVPQEVDITTWLSQQSFYPIYGKEITLKNSLVWDLSVGSTFIGSLDSMKHTDRFTRRLFGELEDQGKTYGIGRYDEVRLLYTEDSFVHKSNNGPRARTLHLGIDIFTHADQPVHAPLDGRVILASSNDLPKDYGHVIILEHETANGIPFFTLYGHLSARSLAETEVGERISKGQIFAWLGDPSENGDWVPHIHFQLITDLVGNKENYPGVADPALGKLWKSLCPDPNLLLKIPGLESHEYQIEEPQQLLELRRKVLPDNLSLSFNRDPLHIVRGHGVYLYDHHAQAYLDTVNNVAHVGHENFEIVKAGQQQMAVLNTNTRYLHSAILKYAEALLSTLPDHLEVVYFCNSGSEANDLAMRLARNHTQADAMIILEQGYHGHTANCIAVSSYKFDGKGGLGKPDHIYKAALPDTYRGMHSSAEGYLSDFEKMMNEIEEPIAGFVGEAILSCGGQIVPPEGYYKKVYDIVRAQGGVCIADEVQTGFGRVGDHFWAFELHDIKPEIVTMGKPIGNGHPLAAVATTRSIATSFDNGMEYFNTYGGNPVSCTIGQAVFEYIENHDLQSKAKATGEHLLYGLRTLQKEHACIGDVRGKGLFLGIEFIEPHSSPPIPSRPKADYVIQRMKDIHIQMSTDGPNHNVIKIKPPMLFNRTHADRVLSSLKMILEEDFMNL